MTTRRHAEAGFTLIETLVAMAILAVAGTFLLTAAERHAARTGDLSDRIAARWVGSNALSAQIVGLGMTPEWQTMLGQSWQVTTSRQSLAGSALDEINVRIAPSQGDASASIVQLRGFASQAGRTLP
ncbi:type II secretion system minor pseudopilin GspI [Puniceibacterium confluentis]|uniref:type II secretion system minor pseudopilin GspI n=1 Tax=Puniceibacterium confluentis TaxID=1958944 RepID=UPI003562B396